MAHLNYFKAASIARVSLRNGTCSDRVGSRLAVMSGLVFGESNRVQDLALAFVEMDAVSEDDSGRVFGS